MDKQEYDKLSRGEQFIFNWQNHVAGGFETALAELICIADDYNKYLLSLAYPDEVGAMKEYMYKDGW